ncbi:MAG TPA: hypothetical protein VF245_09230 [Solirubrobacterales bacterium]
MDGQHASDATDASRGEMRWEDWAVYGLILAGIYLLVGVLFFYAGKEKIFDGLGAPPPIEKQFSGTFLDTIPGVDAAWTILGILELGVFVLTVISLATLEFLPSRRKPFLLSGLALAIFTFSVLGIGQNVVGENTGVAELFLYAGATGVLIGLVLLMPPYRPGGWISSRGQGSR